MADLTVGILHKICDRLPDNAKLMIRHWTGTEFESVEVGLIAYTADNELLFLAAPDV